MVTVRFRLFRVSSAASPEFKSGDLGCKIRAVVDVELPALLSNYAVRGVLLQLRRLAANDNEQRYMPHGSCLAVWLRQHSALEDETNLAIVLLVNPRNKVSVDPESLSDSAQARTRPVRGTRCGVVKSAQIRRQLGRGRRFRVPQNLKHMLEGDRAQIICHPGVFNDRGSRPQAVSQCV